MCVRHGLNDIERDLHRLVDSFKSEHLKMQELRAAERALMEANQEKCVALAMGHHIRLGTASPLRGLDSEVLRLVIASAGLRDCLYLQ